MAESKKTAQASMPGFEVIVGEPMPMVDGSLSFDGECTFQTGADCFRMLEEVQQEGNEISEMVKRLERSKGDYGVPTLSSTASTVASSMASQWLSHMKRSFKRRAMTLSEEQQQIIKKLVSESYYQHGSTEISAKDIMLLYCQGLEAHHEGHYREMFDRIRPCMPFLNTNVLVWIRISEALIYEFYEEVWEFTDIYARLFDHCPRRYMPSEARRSNELRRRHSDMNLRFAETATLMTFALAKHSERQIVHYTASCLHAFLSIKMKRWTEALSAINFALDKYSKIPELQDDICVLYTYKAEALIGQGRINRAIEYCVKVLSVVKSTRTKHRANILMATAYMRKSNFRRAFECVMLILGGDPLDENMLENVALLGLNLAHLMGNTTLFTRFEELLQNIVY